MNEEHPPQPLHPPALEPGVLTASATSRWRDVALAGCVILLSLALLDTAVETFLSGAPVRLAVVVAVPIFFALLAIAWRRTQWTTRAIGSLLFFLTLLVATAWLPGGLDRGIVLVRQPTSSVLAAITGLAVLAAGISLVRLPMPLWFRVVGSALAAYGVSAFVLALISHSQYTTLFHGQSFWARAPFWLQGAYVGVAAMLLAILANVVLVLRDRQAAPAARWRWQLDVPLVIATFIAGAAILPHPGSTIGGGSTEEERQALSQNIDIASLDAGGHVESLTSQWDTGQWATLGLIDPDPKTAWSSKRNPDFPQEIVLSFFNREPALITAVILNPATPDLARERWAKDVEIWASAASATEGFSKIAAVTLRPEAVDQRVDFAPVEARYVKLRILSSQRASDEVELGKIKIVEAQRRGYTPLLTRHPQLAGLLHASLQPVDMPAASDVSVPGTSMAACGPAAVTLPESGHLSENVLVVAWDGNAYPPLEFQRSLQKTQDLLGIPNATIYSRLKFRVVKPREASAALLADGTDTVVLAQLCDIKTSVSQSFKNALLAWVGQGHKLVVQDADSCKSSPDYGFLPYRFATSNPGAGGASGDRLLFVEENTIANARPEDAAFVDLESWLARTNRNINELGDSNTIIQYDPHWCGHLFGTNVLKKNGFMEAYFHYGRGLVIYNGFDIDQGLKGPGPAYLQLVTRELAQPFNPDNLPCSAHLGDFVITTPQRLRTQPMVPGRTYTYPLTLLSNQAYKGTIKLGVTSTPPDPTLTYRFEPEVVELSEISNSTLTVTTTSASPPTLHNLAVRGTDAANRSNALCLNLVERKTGGLQIMAETEPAKAAAARNLEIILDLSGSMKLPLGKGTRIGTARQVLRDVLAKIPDDFNVGLRVYAHRYSSRDKQTCTDTELKVPIQKFDRQRILSVVDSLKPRGETPLVYSILQSPADLKAVGGGSVIVVTDGQETCHGDPVKAAEELKAAGIPVTLNIVGFTLKGKEKEDVERLMRPFAEATGGHYYYAENGEALARALSMAALNKFPYEVFDSTGQQVAKGQAGPLSEALQPGEYKVVVHAGDQELTEKVTVTAKTDTVLKVVRKGNQFVLEHVQGQAEQPQKAASTSGQGQP